MPTVIKTAGKVILFMGLLALAACSAPTPTAAPTQDLNPLRTEVASTVLAQVPQLCALTPTATLQPTSTPTATQTQTPTVTVAASQVVSGTATADQAKWVSQSIADDTRFAPGAAFTITWRIQNVGTTTWTTGYRLRFFSGNLFGAPNEVFLKQPVAPNEIAEISIPMKAPTQVGEYRTDWVMSNEFRRNFNQPIFLKIIVSTTAATSTPTSAASPTATTAAATQTAPAATETPAVTSTP